MPLAEVLVNTPQLAGGCATEHCAVLEGHRTDDGSRAGDET